MDLVNSVTQNSNNRKVTMENQGIEDLISDRDIFNSGRRADYKSDHQDNSNRATSDREADPQLKMMAMEPVEAVPITFDHPPQPQQQQPHLQRQQPHKPQQPQQQSQQQLMSANHESIAQLEREASKSQVPEYLRIIGMDPKKFWPKKYRFTREKTPGQHNPLSVAQRNFYESNGYIIFDDCLPKKSLDSIRAQYKQSQFVDEFLVEKLVSKNNKLFDYIKCFCDEQLMLMTYRVIESFHTNEMVREVLDQKQISRQQLFRDWVYLPFRPIDKVCCAMTALEPLENIVLVVPGTHRVGQCTISSPVDNVSASYSSGNGGSNVSKEIFEVSPNKLSTLVDKSKKGFKYVNLKPGQTMFYHPGLVHGFSNDLVSFQKKQLALVAYYAAADCEFVDQRNSMAELMSTENEEIPITLAHFAPDKHPSDYTSWLDKPILLKDSRSNL